MGPASAHIGHHETSQGQPGRAEPRRGAGVAGVGPGLRPHALAAPSLRTLAVPPHGLPASLLHPAWPAPFPQIRSGPPESEASGDHAARPSELDAVPAHAWHLPGWALQRARGAVFGEFWGAVPGSAGPGAVTALCLAALDPATVLTLSGRLLAREAREAARRVRAEQGTRLLSRLVATAWPAPAAATASARRRGGGTFKPAAPARFRVAVRISVPAALLAGHGAWCRTVRSGAEAGAASLPAGSLAWLLAELAPHVSALADPGLVWDAWAPLEHEPGTPGSVRGGEVWSWRRVLGCLSAGCAEEPGAFGPVTAADLAVGSEVVRLLARCRAAKGHPEIPKRILRAGFKGWSHRHSHRVWPSTLCAAQARALPLPKAAAAAAAAAAGGPGEDRWAGTGQWVPALPALCAGLGSLVGATPAAVRASACGRHQSGPSGYRPAPQTLSSPGPVACPGWTGGFDARTGPVPAPAQAAPTTATPAPTATAAVGTRAGNLRCAAGSVVAECALWGTWTGAAADLAGVEGRVRLRRREAAGNGSRGAGLGQRGRAGTEPDLDRAAVTPVARDAAGAPGVAGLACPGLLPRGPCWPDADSLVAGRAGAAGAPCWPWAAPVAATAGHAGAAECAARRPSRQPRPAPAAGPASPGPPAPDLAGRPGDPCRRARGADPAPGAMVR